MKMAAYLTVYVTCKDETEAKELARLLLEKRLVACANLFPIKSLYWWNGNINEDSEYALILKTKKESFEELESAIKETHSYEVPCICAWNIAGGNKAYLEWVDRKVK